MQASATTPLTQGKNLHSCKFCDRTFKLGYNCKRHEDIVHRKLLPHKCTSCDKVFGTTVQLEGHMNKHLNKRPYKCPVCTASFSARASKNSHLRHVHPQHVATAKLTIEEVMYTKEIFQNLQMYIEVNDTDDDDD